MKKSMILLGMLSIGYAYAQEYDGKVGINTNEPKATLDITPEANNLTGTTNEGIIAPRLSKTRIANIEASKLTEGTLVYSTDAVYTAGADTAKNGRVAKINEKGYYFYNGTEWVKVQYKDTDTNDAEWVYDDATKRINLKRSGQTTGFLNKVYYDTQTGAFIDYQDTNTDNWNNNSQAIENIPFNPSFNYIQRNSKNINGTWKSIANNIMYIDESSTSSVGGEINGYGLTISRANKAPTGWIQGLSSTVRKFDNNASNNMMAGAFNTILHSGSVSKYAMGVRGEVTTSSTGNIDTLYGIGSWASTNSSGDINSVRAYNGYMLLSGSSKIGNISGYHISVDLPNNSSVSVKELSGFKYSGVAMPVDSQNIENHYGLYLANVAGGTKSNYAIYTNTGQVRLGDLAQSGAGDRAVYADENGILKIGTATSPKALNTEDTCTATNAGTFHYKEREVNGQQVGTMGFCTRQNGTYTWVYFSNGANVLQSAGTNKFGEGLQTY